MDENQYPNSQDLRNLLGQQDYGSLAEMKHVIDHSRKPAMRPTFNLDNHFTVIKDNTSEE